MNIIRSLLYFQSIVRSSRINQAADKNGIKASNLSRNVREFEEAYNIHLLDRTRSGTYPTVKGFKLYHLIGEMEKKFDNILAFLNEESSNSSLLRLYLPPNFQLGDLAIFLNDNPQIELSYTDCEEMADVAVSYHQPEKQEGIIIIKNTLGERFTQDVWVTCKENLPSAVALAEFITELLHS